MKTHSFAADDNKYEHFICDTSKCLGFYRSEGEAWACLIVMIHNGFKDVERGGDVIWRAYPEVKSEVDFETGKTFWKGFARFSVKVGSVVA